MKLSIETVRAAPTRFDARVKALVTFVWGPDEFSPVVSVSRYVKPKDASQQGKRFPVAQIAGARSVKIIDAQLWQGEKGVYIGQGDFDIPKDVLQEVANQCAKRMAGVQAENVSAAASDVDPWEGFDASQFPPS